jgi:glycolate oxidase FAD binding subunit
MGTDGAPTIGGVVAANVSGPRRVQAGACRDSLLGVRFVDGEGTVIKNGGRVMKNVTGYDLVKLMAGAYGTLGVLSEVAFKVLPGTAASASIEIEGLGVTEAIAAMSDALGSPFEITGAAHAPVGPDGTPLTMLRIEGFEDSVKYRAGKLTGLLSRYGDVTVRTNPDRVAARWTWVRDAEMFKGTSGDIWRISVKPSDGSHVAEALPGADMLFDWGGGLVWAEATPGTDVRAALGDLPGHATIMRASEETRKTLGAFQPENDVLKTITAGIRTKFDPRGILNPGLMS